MHDDGGDDGGGIVDVFTAAGSSNFRVTGRESFAPTTSDASPALGADGTAIISSSTAAVPLDARAGSTGIDELTAGACAPSVIRAELPPVRARPGVWAALLRADKPLGTRGRSGDPVSTVPEMDRAAVVTVSTCQSVPRDKYETLSTRHAAKGGSRTAQCLT